jgi:hypothetical protein
VKVSQHFVEAEKGIKIVPKHVTRYIKIRIFDGKFLEYQNDSHLGSGLS